MFRTQATIPKYLAIVKLERAAAFLCGDEEVVVAGDDVEVEGAEDVGGGQGVGFVDDGADGGVFVEDDGADQRGVREIGGAQVYLSWKKGCGCEIVPFVSLGEGTRGEEGRGRTGKGK